MKNAFNGLIRVGTAEETVSALQDVSTESSGTKEQREQQR